MEKIDEYYGQNFDRNEAQKPNDAFLRNESDLSFIPIFNRRFSFLAHFSKKKVNEKMKFINVRTNGQKDRWTNGPTDR